MEMDMDMGMLAFLENRQLIELLPREELKGVVVAISGAPKFRKIFSLWQSL